MLLSGLIYLVKFKKPNKQNPRKTHTKGTCLGISSDLLTSARLRVIEMENGGAGRPSCEKYYNLGKQA